MIGIERAARRTERDHRFDINRRRGKEGCRERPRDVEGEIDSVLVAAVVLFVMGDGRLLRYRRVYFLMSIVS